MKHITRLFMGLFICSLIITACHKEIYDPESVRKNFFIPDVPADFDWSSLTAKKIHIFPHDTYGGSYFYTMEIFTANPLVNPEAVLLAKGVCKDGQPWETTISLPSLLPAVYIRQTDPTGKRSILMAATTENTITCHFAPEESAGLKSRADQEYHIEGEDYNADDSKYIIPQLPDQDIEIFDPDHPVLKDGKNYLLKGEYTGKIEFEWTQKGSRLFISGTWKNTADKFDIPDLSEVIILEGGKMISNSACELKFYKNANLYVAENGQLGNPQEEKITIRFTNPGNLINKGKLYADKINTGTAQSAVYNSGELTADEIVFYNSGEFINRGKVKSDKLHTATVDLNILNSGTMIIEDKMETHNPAIFKNEHILIGNEIKLNGTRLINSDSIYAKKLECEQAIIHNLHKIVVREETELKRTTLYNECRVITDELDLEQSTLQMGSQTSVLCRELDADGATIRIGSKAIMEIKEKAEFSTQFSKLYGDGEDFGLIRIKAIEWEGKAMNAEYSGNLEIDCCKFKDNEPYITYYRIYSPAHLTENGTTISIPAGECTGEGHESENGSPENPQFPLWTTLPLNYTWITEDTYPSPGDYDLNDMVIGIDSISYLINEGNDVLEMKLHMRLKAVGALLRLGAALQLDHIRPLNIRSVYRTANVILTDETFPTDDNGTEKGTKYAVIPLFDNAHHVLGLPDHRTITNTIPAGKTGHLTRTEQNFTIGISYNQPVSFEWVSIHQMNFFAIVENTAGMRNLEIHLPGFEHTGKSNTSVEIKENTKNLMWGLMIPANFKYAEEKTDIRKAYPRFQNWVNTNKTEDKDWYIHDESEYIYK